MTVTYTVIFSAFCRKERSSVFNFYLYSFQKYPWGTECKYCFSIKTETFIKKRQIVTINDNLKK